MFSVIIPTYNREDLLPVAIESVIRQTCPDWELLIIDDGSTDGSEGVVQHYLADSRIRYFKKENSGGAQSRNFGVSLAKGDFIVFLDSDDEAYPHWLETAAGVIREDTGIICAGANRRLLDGTIIEEPPYAINVYGEKVKVKFTAGSLFIKRELFLESGGYDMEMPSGLQSQLGYTLLPYLHQSHLKIVTIDQCLVQINIHNGQRARTQWGELTVDCLRFVNKFHPYFEKWDRRELSNNYTVIAFYNYKAGQRKPAMSHLVRAIRYRPQRVSNYLRLVKYTLG
ncbi:glycosyltransferase family A protein [Flavisolibacter nicotianae]|uniref:glycosyltransferase family A protein n=1 Tax=Flavisolibacter nicotianae TaxID=2364882 RepID=UPI000EAC6E83|nr:glycosyltransferase family A protein [Flavisolibacter nicotianae]